MLDRKILQRSPEIVATALKNRNSTLSVEDFATLDGKRRALIAELEQLQGERNTISAQVAKCKKQGTDPSALIEKMGSINAGIKDIDGQTKEADDAVTAWLLNVPNLPHESVPVGKDENDNPVLHAHGAVPAFDFPPKEHWELAPALGGLDFERGSKLTGSRFTVHWGWAARLERALGNFFLDIQTKEHGHMEMLTPYMVNRQAMTGTGQLPKFEEDLFKLEGWDYFLIPTAEVPLTNLYAGEIIPEEALPLRFVAQTPCFRSEAGSYGKDTRGLIRQHQFTKVEMVHVAHPDHSYTQLEAMRGYAETLLQRLELPYRTITLCTGDMGFGATKTYDIEVWLPGQNTYREISSCSNCGDFQARRANIRFKPSAGGKAEFVHTLNGSGLPTGRTLVAIIENGQQADGSVRLPAALIPYMDGREYIRLGEQPSL